MHQVHRGLRQAAAGGFGTRQRQQLVDGVGGAYAGAADLLERLFQLVGIGLALRQVGLHAQAGQRRLELVRGIGQKTFLRGQRQLQAAEQIIDRRHQRRHFFGHRAFVERAHVVGLAGADASFELRQRLDAAHQCQPHQQHRQRQRDELRHHHALDDLGGQRLALFQRLGHLHQHGLALGHIDIDPGVGHAHVFAAHHVLAQAHFTIDGFLLGRRQRQVLLAAQKLAARAQHLVVHQVTVIGAQDFAGRCGQRKKHLLITHHHQLGQRLHVVFERPVKRLAGNVLRHQPGQRQADRPQQQQRREHPVQDLAEQAALATLKNLQGIFSKQ